ncbi:hypothetical protein ACN27E_02135 [Mycobacterium sp. WMMD1722]|uniref:hypothetical protein n=1 Tax=Mycobacterium sp. WMMD1722 TaxID=3404117 RepID=UPI003BF618C9
MSTRYLEVVRAGWGAALVTAPVAVLHTVAGDDQPDRWAINVARILGARHLLQALLSGRRPSPEVLAAGVWVDGVHALTALLLALADRRRARLGLADAAFATVWGGAGWHDLIGTSAARVQHQRVRDRLARAVLRHVPGGRVVLHATPTRRHRNPVD